MNNNPILYQRMIIDNRATKPGNWLMISINKFQHTKFKWKNFERTKAFAFFPLYVEHSKWSTTVGLNLHWINIELTRHRSN